ncbi:unnamed protein product [Prunus armeniaca]
MGSCLAHRATWDVHSPSSLDFDYNSAIYASNGLRMCQLQQACESPIKYLLFSTCKKAWVYWIKSLLEVPNVLFVVNLAVQQKEKLSFAIYRCPTDRMGHPRFMKAPWVS